jgi:hypothetical protein
MSARFATGTEIGAVTAAVTGIEAAVNRVKPIRIGRRQSRLLPKRPWLLQGPRKALP